MDKAVVLIIDMLNDFFAAGPLGARPLQACRADLVQSINHLVRLARQHHTPIIWVKQEYAPDLHDAPLEVRKKKIAITIAGTEGCQLLAELDKQPADFVLVKKRYSAFFGTELDQLLGQWQPQRIILAGINTHACVRTTAIDAYQRDYEVVLAEECIASYDREHHTISMRYMAGKIAQVLRNAEIFA
ncbi:MAG TPA: isochorismatase family cysteine hydrolase [Anaerolineae bacterium]